jgi:hypothetical protein
MRSSLLGETKEVSVCRARYGRILRPLPRYKGVRIISCLLASRSPWLNPIEPEWIHGKRRVMEADGLLAAHELAERVCEAFDCPYYEHLSVPEKVA